MSSYRMKYKIGLVEHSVVVPEDMASVPIGTILPYGANSLNPPFGFLWCDGSAVSRTMYPDLFELIGTLYGSGDGSTTFNLPNLLGGRFLEGTDSAGTQKDAGLPNIEGNTTKWCGDFAGSSGEYTSHPQIAQNQNKEATGAFSSNYETISGYNLAHTSSSQSTRRFYINDTFNASLSNSIYGNSSTVQPKSMTIRYIIRAYTGAGSSANLDLSVYASDLATRLQRQQVPAFNKRVVIATSQTWTAPVNGWYKFTLKGAGGGGQGASKDSSSVAGGGSGGEGGTSFLFEKMTAGQTAVLVIGAGGTGGTINESDVNGGKGADGGNTTVSINSTTYTAYGGNGGYSGGAVGGSGDITGAAGQPRQLALNISGSATIHGASGTGVGGGKTTSSYTTDSVQGGGGAGGSSSMNTSYMNPGAKGGDGFVWIEYFDPTL